MDDKIRQSQDAMRAQQDAIRNEHIYELSQKDKTIDQIKQELHLVHKQSSNQIERL